MSQERSPTLKTFSMRPTVEDEIEVEYYPTGEIKIRITKYNSRGEYSKHASLILSGRDIENLRRNIKSDGDPVL